MSLLMRLYFLSQLVEGLRFLHTRSLYHLDIKPQNMLIGKGFILKITDFGEAYHPNICSKGIVKVLCRLSTRVHTSLCCTGK